MKDELNIAYKKCIKCKNIKDKLDCTQRKNISQTQCSICACSICKLECQIEKEEL